MNLSPRQIDPAPPELVQRFEDVRALSVRLIEPLEPEDLVIQSMPDASPLKWHLAHTTWFFETFLLRPHLPSYEDFNPQFSYLFNSYYNAIGDRIARGSRGLLSRPTSMEVLAYRSHVDRHISHLLITGKRELVDSITPLLELGLNHEQQHQELMVTDLKNAFGSNPLQPHYPTARFSEPTQFEAAPLAWQSFDAGLHEIGSSGPGFSFDNEGPRHAQYLNAFQLASRPVTCGEYLEFIEDDGYFRPELWLSDGWDTVRSQGWSAPLYWTRHQNSWHIYTLAGKRSLAPAEFLCHVSFYEADAFARWASARLPTEAEWETATHCVALEGSFLNPTMLHPTSASDPSHSLCHLYGNVWEWTSSPYIGYPGFRSTADAVGEYNGKFMCNQFVLRGGSCATPPGHIRPTYRNFFHPACRWQFSGIRLAR